MRKISSSLRSLLLGLALLLPATSLAQATGLNNAVKAYNAEKYPEAAFGFYDVAYYDPVVENRLKAEYYLAQSLSKMEMKRAAAFYYQAIMAQGPVHPYYLKSVAALVEVAEEIRDDLFLPIAIQREYNQSFANLPAATLFKINYFTGLGAFRRENVTEAESFLRSVPRESSYYAKALYLQGIIKTFQGREGGLRAIRDYEEILTLKDTAELAYWDLENTKQLALLGLARTHYTLGNYRDSKAWYEKIPRYSTYWDVALFENGWSSFLAEDVGSAMGTLHTLHAPQFSGSFQPESLILKSTVYYFACLYDEVKKELQTFDTRYKPMSDEVQKIVDAHPDDTELPYFLSLVATPDAQGEKLPVPVRNLMLDNQRIKSLIRYLRILDGELEKVETTRLWRGSSFQKELQTQLGKQRQQNVLVTGRFIRSRLAKLVADVGNFDGQAQILRFETSKKEKEMLELGVDLQARLAGQKLLKPELPGDEWEYWGFQGEWWVDELGYYKYTLKSACTQEGGAGGLK
ncbi:MAG: hypothetical protein P1V51_10765 [Deltaproteobacteria bacterium]|nr:hypothetical protein [Deltaproteobacteria bacterium]